MLPRKILCPLDFSAHSYAALDQAVALCRHFGAELGLLYVVPFSPLPSPDLMTMVSIPDDAQRLQDALSQLCEAAAHRVPAGITSHCEVRLGAADHEIGGAVEDGSFDWLVIATHGFGGWKHLMFGSVAEAIVRRVKCPVLTVHAPILGSQSAGLPPVAEESGAAVEAR